MHISIRRNAEGEVTTGASAFKVPKNRSFLSVLGNNPAAHGDEFREDGWVYNDGKKVRKWFISLKDGYPRHIWEPKLDDVITLEAKYQKVHSKLKEFWANEYKQAYEEMKKAKIAHAKPTHKFSPAYDGVNWWLYKVSFYGGAYNERDDSSVRWDWVHEPEEPINLEIGQRYYDISRKNMRWCGYLGRFKAALEESIIRFLQKNAKPEDGKVVDLVINGRRYIYLCVPTSYGFLTFKKEAWPGDNYEQVTV